MGNKMRKTTQFSDAIKREKMVDESCGNAKKPFNCT